MENPNSAGVCKGEPWIAVSMSRFESEASEEKEVDESYKKQYSMFHNLSLNVSQIHNASNLKGFITY